MRKNEKPPGFYSDMTRQEFIKYGKDEGLIGLGITEAARIAPGYVNDAEKRGLKEKIFKRKQAAPRIRRKRILWVKMSDEELLHWGKENGFYGLSSREADNKDSGYYQAVMQRGLRDEIFVNETIMWRKMDDKELIQWGKDHGLYDLSPTEAMRRNAKYHAAVKVRKLDKRVFKPQVIHGFFKRMTDKELIKYGKKHKLFGTSASEAKVRKWSYYKEVRRRGLNDKIFSRVSRPSRFFKGMTKAEFVKYGKDQGLVGLGISEAVNEDKTYYQEALSRGLVDALFVRKKRDFASMTNRELIQYGKDHGLYGLQIVVAQKKDSTYYNIIRQRGLVDKVFKRVQVQIYNQDLVDFLDENKSAKTLTSLTGIGGLLPEIAMLLTQEWPNRFPPYEKLLERLPQIVPKVTAALRPIKIAGSGRELEDLYDSDISKETKADLTEILYRVGVEEYQSAFNRNPGRTLQELRRRSAQVENRHLRQLYRRIEGFYREIFEFDIPGYGTLRRRSA